MVKEKEWNNRNVADWRGITTRYFFTGMMKEEKTCRPSQCRKQRIQSGVEMLDCMRIEI